MNKQVNLSVSYNLRKATFLFALTNSRRTNLASEIKNLRRGARLNANYRLSRLNQFNLSANFDDYETLSSSITALNYRQRAFSLGYTRSFGESASVSLMGFHRNRDTEGSGSSFSENRVTLSFNKEF